MANNVSMIVRDGIGPVLDVAVATTAINVAEAAQSGAADLEAYAKANAPWSDLTGAARNGLTSEVSIEGGVVVIELAHTVDYGVWLETIQNGQYAIIMPTIEALGPQIIADAGAAVAVRGSF